MITQQKLTHEDLVKLFPDREPSSLPSDGRDCFAVMSFRNRNIPETHPSFGVFEEGEHIKVFVLGWGYTVKNGKAHRVYEQLWNLEGQFSDISGNYKPYTR